MSPYADVADIVGGWAKKIQVYADVIEGRSPRMCVCILVEERKEAGLVVHYILLYCRVISLPKVCIQMRIPGRSGA